MHKEVEVELPPDLERLSADELEALVEAGIANVVRCGVPDSVWKAKKALQMQRLRLIQMARKGDVA